MAEQEGILYLQVGYEEIMPEHRLGIGMMLLDQQLQCPDRDLDPERPNFSERWRTAVRILTSHLDAANLLWEQNITKSDGSGGSIVLEDTCLRLDFERGTEREKDVRCGPVRDLTYHGTVLKLASIVALEGIRELDDQVQPGVKHQAPTEGTKLRLKCRQALRDLHLGTYWEDFGLGLDREYAKACAPSRQGQASLPCSADPQRHQQSSASTTAVPKLDDIILWVLKAAGEPLRHQDIAGQIKKNWHWCCEPVSQKTITNHFSKSALLKTHTERGTGGRNRMLSELGFAWTQDHPPPDQPQQRD